MLILPFEEKYQAGVDALNRSVQDEFPEQISSPASRTIAELARQPGERFWVAMNSDTVMGTIGIALLSGRRAVLKRMVVAKDHRGKEKGLSDKLLRTAIGFAQENKVDTIFLGTMGQFKAAQRFYLKRGFVEIGRSEVPADYEFNPVDTVFFKLELK